VTAMAKNPKVSVVILTKNSENVIGDCLDAVFNQTFKDFEVIVVDGNSVDRTIDIVKNTPAKIVMEEGKGKKRFGYARNLGVRAAKGEVVAFVSSDCIPEKNWLEKLIEPLGGKVVATFGRQVFVGEEEDSLGSKVLGKYISLRMEKMFDGEFPPWYYSTVNSSVKRETVKKLGWFDEELKACEDQDLGFRIVGKGYEIKYCPNAIVYNRETTQPIVYAKKRVGDLKEFEKVKRRYLQ